MAHFSPYIFTMSNGSGHHELRQMNSVLPDALSNVSHSMALRIPLFSLIKFDANSRSSAAEMVRYTMPSRTTKDRSRRDERPVHGPLLEPISIQAKAYWARVRCQCFCVADRYYRPYLFFRSQRTLGIARRCLLDIQILNFPHLQHH